MNSNNNKLTKWEARQIFMEVCREIKDKNPGERVSLSEAKAKADIRLKPHGWSSDMFNISLIH